MRRKTFVAALVAGPLLWAAVLPLSAAEVEPIALSVLRSGDVMILDASQGLFLLKTSTGQVRQLTRFGAFEAMDMAGVSLDGSEGFFVIQNLPSSSKANIVPQLVRFNAAGQQVEEWKMPDRSARLSGVAVDTRQKVAYVATILPPEVHKVDLSRKRAFITRMSRVRGAQRLGSMVLDARRGRLLIADPYLGQVYAYDLSSRRSEILFEKLGEIGGLALDPATDRLFISDAISKRILVSTLGSKPTAPTLFAPQIQKQLDEPLGLALGGDGSLWIADREDEKVLLVSRTGQLVRTFSLERVAVPSRKK